MRGRLLFVLTIVFISITTVILTNVVHAQQSTELEAGCTYEGNPTRPGGTCKRRSPYVQTDISQYTLQCAVTPTTAIAGFTCGNSPQTVEVNGQTYIDARLLVDFNKLELGGLGPDETAWGSLSPDHLAQIYPYNGLGDKPLNVTPDTPREAFRTWWRLLPLRQQLVAKAEFIGRFNTQDPPIFDSSFPFIDPTGSTTFQNLQLPFEGRKYNINIGYGHIDPLFGDLTKDQPTTFLIPIGSSTSEIQAFADLYSDSSVRIARVIGLEPNTSITSIEDFAGRLSAIFNRDSDITVFGNELNGEWTSCVSLIACAHTYESQFLAFKNALNGPIRAAAAPMNTSHPSADAEIFLRNAITAYQQSDITAHNTYQLASCAFPATERCTTNSWQWEQQVTGTTGKPKIITEYGLNPAEAESLADWVRWLVDNPPGEELTTILTPNICGRTGGSAAGEWLFLVNPLTIYDLTGQLVNPNSCEANYATFKISDLVGPNGVLPGCLRQQDLKCGGKSPEQVYYDLEPRTRAMYDAFLPFNFDNVRGYLGLNYLDYEGGDTLSRAGVLAENLPYIQAILDALGNKRGGILNTLSPQWLNNRRSKVSYEPYYNYATQSDEAYLEDIEILGGGAGNDTLPTPYPLETFPISYEPEGNLVSAQVINQTRSNWPNDLSCRDTAIDDPYLKSPLTYPTNIPVNITSLTGTTYADLVGEPGFLNQSLLVPVEIEALTATGTEVSDGATKCIYNANQSCNTEGTTCPTLYTIKHREEDTRNVGEPLRSSTGRGITSLTNPLMTTISKLVSENDGGQNNSLFNLFLPKALNALGIGGWQDTPIYAKEVNYQGEAIHEGIEQKVSAGNSDQPTGTVKRKGGQLEIDLCKLRNFWLRPAALQAGKPEDCEDPETLASAPVNESIPGVTTGSAAGELCVPLWVDATTAAANAQRIEDSFSRPLNEPKGQKRLWYDYYSGLSKLLASQTQCSIPELNVVNSPSCFVKAHIFENSCPGGSCYSYLMDKALSIQCDGQTLNPYFAMAVALNESGGFLSDRADGDISAISKNITGTHMGCDPYNALNYDDSIVSRIDCFVNTMYGNCGGLSETEILTKYGYKSTHNLNSILDALVDRSTGVCTR